MNEILTEIFAYNAMRYDLELIRSRSRRVDVVMMRKLACIALKRHGFPYDGIGKFLNRSHCAVLHLVKHSSWARGYDIRFPEILTNDIEQQIQYHQHKIDQLRAKLLIGV